MVWTRPTCAWPLQLILLLGSGLLPRVGHAATECGMALRSFPPVVALRVDNDLFANQDEGYSSGVQLSLVSPNLKDFVNDPCLPPVARWLNQYLDFIQPSGFDQQNMVVKITQGIFTPKDRYRTDLIQNDRPYAGTLLVTFGYNARKGDHLRTTQLLLGAVGPVSLARQSQNLIHELIGVDKFRGWEHQLNNELLINLVHEQSKRLGADNFGNSGFGWDMIGHWGGALGNYRTHFNSGIELRVGFRLPDDFGSSPVRPAGNNTSPTVGKRNRAGWSWNAFVAADARAVFRDITLDGNTFSDSHHVYKEPLVGEVAIGLALSYGRAKFAFARYFRSQEFKGQGEAPTYGSFTVSYAF